MSKQLNIVELIENNPITLLSNTYQNKLLTKIKERFTDNEQQMFIASFYCYLNYNSGFVIDLDDIWRWLGFNTKQNSKRLLESHFTINKDYSLLIPNDKQSPHTKGGHNKEIIMLNVSAFKKFCLKAGTKKADEIHEYYIKLEETLHEVIQEESNELKLQLEQKDVQLEKAIKEKWKLRERTLIEQYPPNTQCVYYGTIDNLSDKNEKLIKFGNSNNLKNRVTAHKDTYENFCLINAFKVDNKLQIENAIKENAIFIERQRTITLKSKKYIELLNMEGITCIGLDKIIKEIITGIEFSPENYIKILEENKLLKKQLEETNEKNNATDVVLLQSENKKLKVDNVKLIKRYNSLKKQAKIIDDENVSVNELIQKELEKQKGNEEETNEVVHQDDEQEVNQDDIDNYGKANKILPVFTKNNNGTYNIDGKIFEKLVGSRDDVWSCKAYKTTGGLIKSDFIVNVSGKIVSKRKCILETMNNRFLEANKLRKEKYQALKNLPESSV
jgi:hypothetical protein